MVAGHGLGRAHLDRIHGLAFRPHTGSMLYQFATSLFGPVDIKKFLVFHFYLRKTGHVTGYGILSLLLLRGWRHTLDPARAWLAV